jgi:hypothetical protein
MNRTNFADRKFVHSFYSIHIFRRTCFDSSKLCFEKRSKVSMSSKVRVLYGTLEECYEVICMNIRLFFYLFFWVLKGKTTGAAKIKCTSCQRRFPTSEALALHETSHNGATVFECKLCLDVFESQEVRMCFSRFTCLLWSSYVGSFSSSFHM